MSTKTNGRRSLFIGVYLGSVDLGAEIDGAYLGAEIYGAEVRATSVQPWLSI
jgi:hypothetical protein